MSLQECCRESCVGDPELWGMYVFVEWLSERLGTSYWAELSAYLEMDADGDDAAR